MSDVEHFRPLMSLSELATAKEQCQQIADFLDKTRDINTHRLVDQTFYMQKVAEFALLYEQLKHALETVQKVQQRAASRHNEARAQWDKDRRVILRQVVNLGK